MSSENEIDNEDYSNNIIGDETYDELYQINSWDEIEMDPFILRGIYSYGFENPSPIQKKAIKPIIMGKDIIAQAQSGTGKTAAFSVGALACVNLKENNTQVCI